MKQITQTAIGTPDVLQLAEVATPQPGPGELLIRMAAAGVNPVDPGVSSGMFPILGEPPFSVGWDVAGTVEAVGSGVTGWATVDRAFGMPFFPKQAAAFADYVLAPAAEMAKTPDALSDAQAGALPLAGLTAWQGLVRHGGLKAGEKVLVHGGAGGVGHLAVQIAKALGAHVTATGSAGKQAAMQALGADVTVDYAEAEPEGPFDLIFDTRFGQIADSLARVKAGGRVIALLPVEEADTDAAAAKGVTLTRIVVEPDAEGLTALADLATRGKLDVKVAASFPLSRAAEAFAALAGKPVGKVILTP
ncbi:NADP-dependent oxidoreductase [Pseudooceanicola sp. C21-150M6]|uniref:NADP-dependent oxidoreductase n=1 Tax=Pseudooceanicola sp. C21-150M6 TaxID=3434355 RepID=UPI003D7F81E1